MASDYLWDNAPLIEVIAEIHWSLKSIETTPDAKIDPYYDLFKEVFVEQAKNDGLGNIQVLIPDLVPLELMPSKPRLRFRSASGVWPVAQIGPGVLTANITPPYDGWAKFEPFLHKMVDWLFSSYPLPDRALRIDRLHLRYIDGFDNRFGFEDYVEFADAMLGIPDPLGAEFVRSTVLDGARRDFILENRFQNVSPKGSSGVVKTAPAQVNNKDALVLELHCNSRFEDRSATDQGFIKGWFLEAHNCVHSQFQSLVTDELENYFGERREIG